MNFEIKLIFLMKPLFLHEKKSHDKNINVSRTKRAFKIFLRNFLAFNEENNAIFLEGESPTLSKVCYSEFYIKVA